MKVLLISHYPPPAGGIASWTKRLLDVGLPNDWEIDHINLNTINGRDPFQNTKRCIKDEYIRTKTVWQKEIRFLKDDREIEIVHTCIPCTVFGMIRETITGMIAKCYKKKFILHCRCTIPNVVNSAFKRIFFRLLSRHCDGIMVLNSKSFDFAKKYSKAKVKLIPNFVTNEEIVEHPCGTTDGDIKNIIYVGGVTAEKGCDTILEAAKRMPEIVFHLVGSVSAEIEALEHSDNIVFYGNRNKDDIKELLCGADAFLFLSRYWGEGFSNALAEAMAAGLPCIVTDWAANADMIEDKGGYIVPQSDVQALIEAINQLNDPKKRKEMSEWNVIKIKSEYLQDIVLRQYTDFYDELVKS